MACTCPDDDVPGWCLDCFQKLQARLIAGTAIPPNMIEPSTSSGEAKRAQHEAFRRRFFGEAAQRDGEAT